MDTDELTQRRDEVVRRISVLEWDSGRKQIHSGHIKRLEELKTELTEINVSLNPDHSVVIEDN